METEDTIFIPSVNVDIQEGAIGRALFLIGLLAVVAGTGLLLGGGSNLVVSGS